MAVREGLLKGRKIGYVGGTATNGWVAWTARTVKDIGTETVLRDEAGEVLKYRRMKDALAALAATLTA